VIINPTIVENIKEKINFNHVVTTRAKVCEGVGQK
jgi:hypothetical protein